MDLLPLSFVVIGATSIWVLVDAVNLKVRKGKITGFFNMGPAGWFLCCLLLWLVAFPAYLVKRREYRRMLEQPPEAATAFDAAMQIAKLAQLHSAGAITEEEFAEKKRELLARM